MELEINRFKAALRKGRQQFGLWCTLPGGYVAEAIAGSGFDWLLFDTEHSPADPLTVLQPLQAVARYPVAAVVRPASNDAVLIKRLLDLGVQSLVIPYVQSAAEARAAVASTRYPPEGIRGVAALTRATRFGRVADYAKRAHEELAVVVQVETRAALDALEDIVTVEGVDGVFVGPGDLAATLGFPGEPHHEEVKRTIEETVRRIRTCGKAAGVLATDLLFARRCMELGATFTAVGIDVGVLTRGAEELVQQFRDLKA
ncbi:MAG: aldolase/citrate lyase family protein [Steroidobacteraceae bacterium]